MKVIYPAVFTKTKKGYVVSIPDIPINTQGIDMAEAIDMARDAMGLMGIDMEDDKKPFPEPTPIDEVKHEKGDIVSLVDVDLTDYRKKHERRTVRRNVSLPSWLDYEAEKAGFNVSAVLQDALKERLGL
jgi:predicted RNase H-like HicB family nuclease